MVMNNRRNTARNRHDVRHDRGPRNHRDAGAIQNSHHAGLDRHNHRRVAPHAPGPIGNRQTQTHRHRRGVRRRFVDVASVRNEYYDQQANANRAPG